MGHLVGYFHSCTTMHGFMNVKLTQYHSCPYSRLPEDEPSGSKHVEDIVKIKILV